MGFAQFLRADVLSVLPSRIVPRVVSGSDGVVRAEGPRPLPRVEDLTPRLSKVSRGHDAPAIDLRRHGQVDTHLAFHPRPGDAVGAE